MLLLGREFDSFHSAFLVMVGLMAGSRVMTAVLCVAEAIALKRFDMHGPRPICFMLTLMLYVGVAQVVGRSGVLLPVPGGLAGVEAVGGGAVGGV